MNERVELMKVAIEFISQTPASTADERVKALIVVYEAISNEIESFAPKKK